MSFDAPEQALSAAAEARRDRLAEAAERGVGVQYWGPDYDAATLARAPHGLLIMEAARIGAPYTGDGRELYFSRDEVREIRDGGRRVVLGYINVAEIERLRDYRSDAQNGPEAPAWRGPISRDGEWLANYWTPEWEEIVLARVDRVLAQGYDGVFLDDALHYYTFAASLLEPGALKRDAGTPMDAAGFARAMMRLVRRAAERARSHDREALVVVNNAAYIGRDAGPDPVGAAPSAFDAYRAAIDGVLMEAMFAPNANPASPTVLREDYLSRGIAVISVDFVSAFSGMPPDRVRDLVASRAQEQGFAPYVADNPRFDRLYPPITGR